MVPCYKHSWNGSAFFVYWGKIMEKISICKFMLLYHGIPLKSGAKYSHEIIKKVFDLKTYPSDYVEKNMGLVATGDIISVEDSYGDVQIYDTKHYDKENNEFIRGFNFDENCEHIELEDDSITEEEIEEVKELLRNLSDLPPVKLREILERFKGIDSICRHVIKEMRDRKIHKPKRYRKQKLLYQAKGMENPDKYERRIEIDYKNMK